jgi:hypothetical protein
MKPIDRVLKNICSYCESGRYPVGVFWWACTFEYSKDCSDACTLEDWGKCPHNESKNEWEKNGKDTGGTI